MAIKEKDLEPEGWIHRMHCDTCKNDFWVPDYGEGLEELTNPRFCPFCGIEFTGYIKDGEDKPEEPEKPDEPS